MEKKLVALDYKGKHFILADEDCVGEFDAVDPYIDADKVAADDSLLAAHIADCDYYGIPPYHGSNDALKKRIEALTRI